MRKLYIYEWIDAPLSARPFRIVESYPCIDGMRQRITARTFSTLEQAQEFVKAHSNG